MDASQITERLGAQTTFRTGATGKGWPFIGMASSFRQDPLGFLHEAMLSQGDIVWMSLGPLSGRHPHRGYS
jgi:hypothetical protein